MLFGRSIWRKYQSIFCQEIIYIIEILQDFSEIRTVEVNEKEIRGFLITNHNKLFYRVTQNELILLNFFDTRQDPGNDKY